MRKKNYGLHRDGRGIWHTDFSVAGQRIQRSTFTADRAKAEEWCATQADRIWRERKLGEAPSLTWRAAVALWMQSKKRDDKRDLANDADKARVLEPEIPDNPIHQLTSLQMDAALDRLAQARSWSNTTRNRHRSFVLGVLNFARRKGYAAASLTLERRREPEKRIRYLSREEAARLVAALPAHLARMARFSLATGLRQSNVTGLCWSDVSMERRLAWVWAEDAKGRRNISVPLSDAALAVLAEARDCKQHGHERHCFTYYGTPIEQPANTAWLRALREAGIENFRWHDMRHTWASWHAMAGTPMPVLQELGGWRDLRMVLKYAHLAPAHTASFAGNVGGV